LVTLQSEFGYPTVGKLLFNKAENPCRTGLFGHSPKPQDTYKVSVTALPALLDAAGQVSYPIRRSLRPDACRPYRAETDGAKERTLARLL